jgi:glycosyltransferase involved in cell wall biosynthesis
MAACACFISRKPYVFDVRDVYPLVYANSGFITRRGYLFKILNKVAQQCYLHSQFITTVTPKLVRYLQTFSGRRQVHLIKNGYNHRIFKPSAEKFDRFTLVFHGNIGQFQHPQLLVDVVNELNHRGLLFDCLVIGSGSRQQVIEKQQIPNLKYLGRLENEKLYRIISKAHVGISFRTDDEISTRSIPVKLSEYVGVGIPSVLTPKSEGGDLLDQLHLGRSFGNQELQQICDFITRLHDNEGYYQHYVQHIMQVRPMFSREAGAQLLADLMYHYQHHPGEEFVNQHTQVFSLLPEVTA